MSNPITIRAWFDDGETSAKAAFISCAWGPADATNDAWRFFREGFRILYERQVEELWHLSQDFRDNGDGADGEHIMAAHLLWLIAPSLFTEDPYAPNPR